MIRLSIALTSEGVIERLEANGHAASGPHGQDIVCAAFTLVLRTFARSVESASGVDWVVRKDQPGDFVMTVEKVPASLEAEYRGWCGFLLRGFDDLQADAPKALEMRVTQSQRRVVHGS